MHATFTRRLTAGSLAGILAAAALLAGCGSPKQDQAKPQQQTSTQQQAAPAAKGPKKGGTLTVGRPTDAVSLDPHAESTSPGNWVMSNIYETLTVLTPDMKFAPGLAERWEQPSPDRWRFHLRKGVKFHDGTDFKADAVKFSIDRMVDKNNPGRSASNLTFIKSVEVKDDYTVDFVTDGPYGPMLNITSLIYATGVVSPAAVQKYGKDYGRNPVGTGPFKFVEWKTNNSITIERFDGYWGEKALLDKVVYRVIPEESARMLALQTGEVDLVMNPAPADLPGLRKDKKFTIHEVPGVRVVYVGANLKKEPLNDARVRQALNHATDRKAIVDNILEGAAVLPTAYISPGIVGYKDVSSNWAYDPKKAEQLLDDAGWKKGTDGMRSKDGKSLTISVWTPKGRYLKDAESVEAWQGQMRKIGVDVKVEVQEWGKMFTAIRSGPDHPAQMFLLGWSTATGDADYTLGPLFGSKNLPPRGWNSYNYINPKIDELAEKGQKTIDSKAREAAYGELLEILAKDAPLVPLYNVKEIITSAASVKDFKIHPIDYFLWFQKVWLDK